MIKFPYVLLIIFILMFSACEEIIQIELDDGVTRLVVEGRIEKLKGSRNGYQRIILSTTDNYFSQVSPPSVNDAKVIVYDDFGNSYPFTESATQPGVYETDSLFAEVFRTYTLIIDYDGETYSGEVRMLSVPPIDSIYQEFQEDTRSFGNRGDDSPEGYIAMVDFTDPAGAQNYYQWEILLDGEFQIEADPANLFLRLQNDEFFDGQKVIGHQPDNTLFLDPGQAVVIRQIALSQLAYDYYSLLFSQSAERGVFDTPPATVRGNVQNITDPGHYPLGYFSAAEVAEAYLIIF
ncbi:MAG: DUF4249 domain-containing protein [Deferribacteres bacterium]|nr:DUF4249 domain-containing protein [Deferribacteres bacterium]